MRLRNRRRADLGIGGSVQVALADRTEDGIAEHASALLPRRREHLHLTLAVLWRQPLQGLIRIKTLQMSDE